MMQRFTNGVQKVFGIAKKKAEQFKHNYVGTEHILLGLVEEGDGVAAQALSSLDITAKKIETLVLPMVGEGKEFVYQVELTPRTKLIVELAISMANRMGNNYVGTEHLLLALLQEGGGIANQVLADLGIRPDEVVKAIESILGKENLKAGMDNNESRENSTELGNIGEFVQDLTVLYQQGKIDPVIGRENEINRVIQILSRRTKNNPVLIGEPGVGKTAIAEGLAARIVEGNVPDILKDKKIVSLSLTAMVAGAKYRGEFEERLKKVIDEVQKQENLIIFIDELHTLIGAGASEGAMDAANILKPALARGSFQVIGATTLDEYKKHIEKDAALERRFQPVLVGEPSEEEAIQILEGLRDRYEAFHKAKITDEAIKAAVNLTSRYISDRFLPDKAIDVMDEAASMIRMQVFSAPPDVKALEEELANIRKEKEAAISSQNFEAAAIFRDREKEVSEIISQKQQAWKKQDEEKLIVTEDDIAKVVATWTKIPVNKITEEESRRLLNLEEELHKRVIGQDEAVSAIAKAVRRARAGLKDPKRPVGSFLFLGPTGVGKTELARSLATLLFGHEDAMIRLDMSEYMEKHAVSRLVGAPPGYVGYDEGGQLTDAVRRKPYSVILFDEVEKAHPDFFNILLQVLDDGHLTDNQGRKIDFRNTVIIMTSNLGAQHLQAKQYDAATMGFLAAKDKGQDKVLDYKEAKKLIMEDVKKHFRPEFLNRTDEMLVFQSLKEEELRKILQILLSDVIIRLEEKELHFEISEEVQALLIKEGADLAYGARPLKRTIQKMIEDPLADLLLQGNIKPDGVIRAYLEDEKSTEVKFEVK